MNKKKMIAALTVLVMVMSSLVMFAPPAKAATPYISLATIAPGDTWNTDESSLTDMGSTGNLTFYTPSTDQSGVGLYDVQYYPHQEDIPAAGYSDGTYNNAWNVQDQMSAGGTSAECIVIHETIPGVQGWPATGGTYIGSTNMTLTTASTDYLPSIHLEEIPAPAANLVGADYVNITWTGLLEQISDEYYSDLSEDWGPLQTNNIVNYSVYRSTDNTTWTFVGNSSAQVHGGPVYFNDTGLSSGTYYYRIGVNFRYPGNTGSNVEYQTGYGLYIGLTAAGYTPEDSTQFPGIYMSQGKGNGTGGIVVGSANTATATGPVTASSSNVAGITITYNYDAGATSVDLYYTTDGGTTWNLIGNDATIDGSYAWTIPADGTYGWMAVADGETAPTGGEAPEAASYIYDGTAPTVTSTTPADGAPNVAVGDNVVVVYSETMDNTVTPNLSDSLGTTYTFAGWSTTTVTDDTATWTHADWALSTTVDPTVSGGQDLAGNVQTAYAWSFTTAADSTPPVVTINSVISPLEGGAMQIIGATVDDSTTGGSNIVSATYTVTAPSGMVAINNASMSAVDGAFDSPTEAVTASYSTVGWATGTYTVDVYGSDGNIGSDSTTYIEQDTSAPALTYVQPGDGATVAADQAIIVLVDIADANQTSDIDNTTVILSWNNGTAHTLTMTYDSNGVGNTVKYVSGRWSGSIPAQADGTTISYHIDASDVATNAATGPTYTITASSTTLSDPYTAYGYVYLYNGNAGVYNPLLCDGTAYANANVDVSWLNSSSGLTDTVTVATDALGRYEVDLHNYTDGGAITVNASDSGNAARYNINTTAIVATDGGSLVNVTFGIPARLNFTDPTNPPVPQVSTGSGFNVQYTIYDVNGVIAPGYYGTVHITTDDTDPSVVLPADLTFDGVGGAVGDGQANAGQATLITIGLHYLNITDTGSDLTPPAIYPNAGQWWDNITVDVTGQQFSWDLSLPGWHICSVPVVPVASLDSASEITALIDSVATANGFTLTDITIANRTGSNPSTYDTYIYGSGGVDFSIEVGMAYWVYVDQGFGSVGIQGNNYTSGTFTKNLYAGWNMIGIAHNYTGNSVVDFENNVNPGVAGAGAYITYSAGTPTNCYPGTAWYASYWNVGTQSYQSYVYQFNQPTDARNQATNIMNGATGFWLYVPGGGTMTYAVDN